MRVAHNSLATDKPVALKFPIELEFGSVGFCGGRKTGGEPENPEKNPWSRDENQQQTQPTYDAGSGNQTRATWWEASALTTAPSLLPLLPSLAQPVTISYSFLPSSLPLSFPPPSSPFFLPSFSLSPSFPPSLLPSFPPSLPPSFPPPPSLIPLFREIIMVFAYVHDFVWFQKISIPTPWKIIWKFQSEARDEFQIQSF